MNTLCTGLFDIWHLKSFLPQNVNNNHILIYVSSVQLHRLKGKMQNTIKYASTIITWQWYKVSAESVSVSDVVTMKGTLATPATILRHMVPVPTLPLSFGLATLMSDAAWCAMGNCIGVSWPWCCIQVNSWWIESEEIIWKVPCTIFPNPCLQ